MFVGFQLSNQIFVSSITLLVIDWLATLDTEIEYVWKGPRTLTKIFFFCVRYLVFFERALGVYIRTPHSIPVSHCIPVYIVSNVLSILVVFLAELTMTFRAAILWRRNSFVQGFICFMSIANTIMGVVTMFLPMSTSPPTASEASPGPVVCFLVNHLVVIVPYIFVMAHETFIFILTIIKGVGHYRTGLYSSSLSKTLYYDGILYYALAIAPFIATLLMFFLAEGKTRVSATADVLPVILSILASRLSLHLRRQTANRVHSASVLAGGTYGNL